MITERQLHLIELEQSRALKDLDAVIEQYTQEVGFITTGTVMYHRGMVRGIALIKELLTKFE